MKFLIDAQFPQFLKQLFFDKGYDCIHTFKLGNTSNKGLLNFSPDRFSEIISKIQEEDMILISKD